LEDLEAALPGSKGGVAHVSSQFHHALLLKGVVQHARGQYRRPREHEEEQDNCKRCAAPCRGFPPSRPLPLVASKQDGGENKGGRTDGGHAQGEFRAAMEREGCQTGNDSPEGEIPLTQLVTPVAQCGSMLQQVVDNRPYGEHAGVDKPWGRLE